MNAAPARAGLVRLAASAAPAAILLAGCNTIENINPLAALDGRYVRADESAATAEAQPIDLTPPAPGEPAPPARSTQPAPAPPPTPVVAPPPPTEEPEPEPEPAPFVSEPPAPTSVNESEPAPLPPPLLAAASPVAAPTEEPAPGPGPSDAPQPTVAEVFAGLAEDESPALAVAAEVPEPVTQEAEPAPLSPPPSPPPPVAAQVTPAQPVGPQLVAEEPGRLETRIASAFDLAQQEAARLARATPTQPAPSSSAPPAREEQLKEAAGVLGLTVATRMPAPGEALPRPTAAGQGPWHDFTQWALDRLGENPAGGARESMLLLDPPAIDPALKPCGNLPPAVLIDLDPANGLLPLVATEHQHPVVAADLAQLRQRGVTIYWISGHGPEAASAIRRRLAASGLDPDGVDPLIVTRFAGESKQARRYGLGESNCLLAIAGDHRADFDELYDFVLDPIMAAPLEGHVGHGWFIAPPPLD